MYLFLLEAMISSLGFPSFHVLPLHSLFLLLSSDLTPLFHAKYWFQHSFLYILSSLGYKFLRFNFCVCLWIVFVETVPRNKIRRKMKDQIAQRNKITRKKWQSILHVVGWHEKIDWHQTFGRCIVGVVFIFTSKISSKNEIRCQKLKV